MFTFTIENADFLNDFYKELKKYIRNLYGFTAQYLIDPTIMEDYKEQEKLTLILINKSIYQNIFNMMAQLDNNMVFSSLSCLENALYNIRLYKALKGNRNNLYKYMTDEYFDLKRCEEIAEKNTDFKDKNEFSMVDFYKDIKSENRFTIRRYIISMYRALSSHNELFFNGGIDKDTEEIEGAMYRKFMDYIRLYA